jgi:regulation of enolase protein 1 (concanavalin A-like superfamily)
MSTDKTGTIQTDATAAVAIGNSPLGNPGGLRATFHGLIDDVRIYKKGMTAAEIPKIMIGDPTLAWGPKPADGSTTDIEMATPLSWTPGEKAAKHDVYLGTDRDAVEDADTTTTGIYRGRIDPNSYTPPEGVEFSQTYYWRIDEFNTDATISTGRIWSFTVADYLIVDDFESYDDYCNRIFYTWPDGWGHNGDAACGVPAYGGNGTGSTVGYLQEPYAEQTIVHEGDQSMPFEYLNDGSTGKALYSETERTFDPPQDWTKHGVKALTLWFRGLPGPVGGFSYDAVTDVYTMTGSGEDIWNVPDFPGAGVGNYHDEFHYAYKQLSGVGSIEAQVLSVQNTNGWAKAGVMIRETLDANSVHAMVAVTPSNGVSFQRRNVTGEGSASTTQGGIQAPHWVRLTRSGNNFTAEYSADGSTWEAIGTENIAMAANVYVGLALTSHNAGAACTATFSDVTTTGTVTGQWQSQDLGIASNDAEQLYVALEDSTGTVKDVPHPDPNAVQLDTWQEWNIDLADFAPVDLTRVKKIYIGVGNRNVPTLGGGGMLYIDDIRLYQPRCFPDLAKPAASFNNDCIVDYLDLQIMADDWLSTGDSVGLQQPSETELVAHWSFDDTLNDITGNGHDGTAMNGASIVGGALVLNGDQQYVEVAHDPALNLTNAFTIAAFVTLDDASDRRPIITKEHLPDASRGWNCWIQDGEPRMQLMDGVKWADTGDVGQSKLTVTSSASLDAGTVYHLAFVYDSAGPEQIYVDGVLQVSEDVVTGTLNANEQPVLIGAYIWDLGVYHRYIAGSIDDLRIYSRVLSEGEIGWLAGKVEPSGKPSDLNADGAIDFKDYAILAGMWLDEALWP